MQSSLERVRRQLSSTSTRQLLQGPLLKRSDTLRKWNERWVILDPTTGKIEYKYDIGTPQKKEYFLCAETPSAARAWVSTLHAAQLVLQAHKEAVNSLGENGPAKLGTVATVVAIANSTAIEATKEVEAAMKISLRAALGSTTNKLTKGQLDDLTIMMGKARGNAVILEAAVVRAEEKARVSAADADFRVKEAMSRLESAIKENEDLLALVDTLQSQIKRQETSKIQVCEESSELCSTTSKHVEDDNVDKACVSDTDPIPVAENIVELDDEGVDIRTTGDTEWGNPHSSEVSDVREVTTEPEENSLDIPVDT
ncbi:hypothetical protein C2845_PM04G02000 [Panicum miliaceum]|uniref:PH domain-containing protein n=1 Tax=Panicum miliaceum TaxID=4540 RepID=A0A3L6QTV6_PANMI|nr:hypothetical protein C2845_PM04G02000 [Panicum miliaceum]